MSSAGTRGVARASGVAMEEPGLGTRVSKKGKYRPCQGAMAMQSPQPVALPYLKT